MGELGSPLQGNVLVNHQCVGVSRHQCVSGLPQYYKQEADSRFANFSQVQELESRDNMAVVNTQLLLILIVLKTGIRDHRITNV